MSLIKKLKMDILEEEYYSFCCEAPPLYELDQSGPMPLGMCMDCRDNSTFYLKADIE